MPENHLRLPFTFILLLILPLTACAGERGSASDDVVVVATTSILGDVVANVLGDAGAVEVLMEPGVDPHDFQPTPQQAARLRTADLVVVNGLGLEEGLSDVLDSARTEGASMIEIAPQVDPIPFAPDADGAETEDLDPHFWLDPRRMADAVVIIGEELAAVRTGSEQAWTERAERYRGEVLALDEEIQTLLADIPPQQRKLVTGHEALGYFAVRYDFRIVGTVIPGGNTLAQPAASDLAELVETMAAEGVTAVFVDGNSAGGLAQAVADELGADVHVHTLRVETLGEAGSDTDSYLGLMRENARTIAVALG